FKTKAEALKQGTIAYNEYLNTGRKLVSNEMSYSDFLDYWLDNHCKINLKYHTIEAYSNIVKTHLKPNLGFYKLSQITKTTLQDFLNKIYVEKAYSKNFLNNIRKVLKCSFNYAVDNEYVKINSAANLKLPKYDEPPKDVAHIFTTEEINTILNRFKKNHCIYYAFLTAYCTGLRIAEVFALTWDDIDFKNKTISVNKNILKKNQAGGTKGRHLSGNSTTVWYFGTCKTQTSYRTVPIGDTLLKALKEYKEEQQIHKLNYGDTYMKHYKKNVINPYNNKTEIKIVNAYTEIDVALPEVDFVFVKNNGVYEGTDSTKYPFKVIHYELGIPCRFHDFRDTHATRLIESGADIKAVSKRLGHRNIDITYNIYVRVTEKMENETANKFEEICKCL
ncbi:MAG: site-specific integrase, partial [Bdellovibrionota bacterium]|nr:site-specific integrase [Bdellovibrionota bacterium]